MSPLAGSSASSATKIQLSSLTSCCCLMSGIHGLLERLHAYATVTIEESLVLRAAQLQVLLHDALHGIHDLLGRQRRSHDLAERRVVAGRAAERELVGLLAALV